MAKNDIPAGDHSIKIVIAIGQTPFELWASTHHYDIASSVSPIPTRVYADRQTQAACDAFNAGAASVARMFFNSTFETEDFREKMRALAGVE